MRQVTRLFHGGRIEQVPKKRNVLPKGTVGVNFRWSVLTTQMRGRYRSPDTNQPFTENTPSARDSIALSEKGHWCRLYRTLTVTIISREVLQRKPHTETTV